MHGAVQVGELERRRGAAAQGLSPRRSPSRKSEQQRAGEQAHQAVSSRA